MTTPWQKDVREFHQRFGAPAPDTLQSLDGYRGDLRIGLIAEELDEFAEAWHAKDRTSMVDAIVDIIYVAIGSAVEMGVDLEPLWEEVQRTNMAKLWPDGEVHFGPQGKILKPPGWTPPAIDRLLAAQIRAEAARGGADPAVPATPLVGQDE